MFFKLTCTLSFLARLQRLSTASILASKYNKIRLVTAFKQAIKRVSSDIEVKDIIIDDIDVETRKVSGTIKIVYGGEYGEYNF